MMLQAFRRAKDLSFERTYTAPIETVWEAWTHAEILRQWWGPDKTTIPECELDLSIGGTIRIVMKASEEMGKYQGTRWPMVGTFTLIEENARLVYEARSWTEGEEDTTTIVHTNDLTLTENGEETVVELRISITEIGSKAKMAAFGMKWGYQQQLEKLDDYLRVEQ